MDSKQIRDNCYGCGKRSLLLMKGSDFSTDFCDASQMECSKIKKCDPSMRTPKKGEVRFKRAVEDV